MPLQFKHFKQILEDFLSYVVGHSDATDTNPGSIIRTIGEAYGIEAAQLYVAIRALLNLFSIDKASGEDLDERAADFGETREQPTKSSGKVTIGDSNLTVADTASSTLKTALLTSHLVAVIQDADYASFPASGSIIVDRGDPSKRELIAYSSKTGPDTLNLDANPIYDHDINATVNLSTVGSDRAISEGTVVKTTSPEVKFDVTEDSVLLDGEYQVIDVPVESQETGLATNAAAGTITSFEGSPFPTATVTNPEDTGGGQDLETDSDFRDRIKENQQALSSSTNQRIISEVLKIVLGTGQRVVAARLVEPVFIPGEGVLYISDGTAGFTPTFVDIEDTEVVIARAEPGQTRGRLDYWPLVANSQQLYVSLDRGEATSVGAGSLTDTSKAWVVNQWAGFKVKDVNDDFFTISSNTAQVLTVVGNPALGPYAIFDPSATLYPTGSKLTEGTDYEFNDTNGEFELAFGLQQNDMVLAFYDGVIPAYRYYDGLVREVQRVVNGDPDDLDTYPGIKAFGTKILVTNPTILSLAIEVGVTAETGIDELTIRSAVKSAILQYVNNLGIGEDVLVSKLVEAALSVEGVYDAIVFVPTTNVIVTDSQLAKTTLSSIEVT